MAYTLKQVKARYPEAYKFTLQYEGGYVDNPNDPGGCTNMGITIGTLQDWRDDDSVTCSDVAELDEGEAAEIYAANYWAPVWGNDLPVGVNTQVWDFGVNAGSVRAIKKLQGVVGSPVDGMMGPNTLSAVKDYIDVYGIQFLLNNYHDVRQEYYESLSTWDDFGNGWTRRNNDCLALSLTLASSAYPVPKPKPDPSLLLEDRVAAIEQWIKSF